ncbi:PIN domain-containing protein [Saccharolobus solfataricus]|uniref:PIN domain-containing protein n=2 Tax=Saccharolobus solfataricus TaxID=2287 RepID=Q97YF9_SACS2|nr:PIN domain-containing protein [Saccharolobus solfataricus]AAK41599.1 Hypothetical protein SSO1365 [Saccharolobus solfataricus P2]SAI85034.1 uncharacterised protein [Saccharolobus solfataricus]
MEKLATLGSDKSVTTINAIMTELLTDLKPTQIIILRESPPHKRIEDNLKKALSYLGINVEVKDIVIGEGVKTWREKISEYDPDVLDITPGRKYMALTTANYSKAREVRYVYLKNENEGYRVFGYVPFNEIKIFNMRNGEEIKFRHLPLTTAGDELDSELDIESLTALYNILSLHGEVKIKLGDNNYIDDQKGDEFIELCKTRSGMRTFREEEKILDIIKKEDALFVADTNVYISLGNRIKRLFYDREKGFRLIPSTSVYRELKSKTQGTQKDPNLIKFILGLQTFKEVHLPSISQLEDRLKNQSYGDVELKKEVNRLKTAIPTNVYLVTMDQSLGLSASTEIKPIVLKTTTYHDRFDMGEYLNCLSYYHQYYNYKNGFNAKINKQLILELNGNNVVKITNTLTGEPKVDIKTLDKRYNYAKVLEVLKNTISQ